jgi:hypothetical protein
MLPAGDTNDHVIAMELGRGCGRKEGGMGELWRLLLVSIDVIGVLVGGHSFEIWREKGPPVQTHKGWVLNQ